MGGLGLEFGMGFKLELDQVSVCDSVIGSGLDQGLVCDWILDWARAWFFFLA